MATASTPSAATSAAAPTAAARHGGGGSAAGTEDVPGDAATLGLADELDAADDASAVASAVAPGTARICPTAPPRASEPERSVPSPVNARASPCGSSGSGTRTGVPRNAAATASEPPESGPAASGTANSHASV